MMASNLAETRKSHNNNKVSNINMSHFFSTCYGLQRTWLMKVEKVGISSHPTSGELFFYEHALKIYIYINELL